MELAEDGRLAVLPRRRGIFGTYGGRCRLDEALATYLLSLGSKGNVRTTTLKLFPEAEFDKIVAKVA
jgi:hypothetical protein